METDIELLKAARMMDKDALVKIFDLYSSPLYKYSLRFCGDPLIADHIVGDVFAKLLEQLSSGNGPTVNLRPYLYEITYHLIVDEARHSYRSAPLEALGVPRQDVQSRLSLEDQLMFEIILNAILNDLTDDQRHVIILRFWEEFSLGETAAIIGKKASHVKVIESRAIAKLRKVFEHNKIMTAVSLPRIGNQSKTLGT